MGDEVPEARERIRSAAASLDETRAPDSTGALSGSAVGAEPPIVLTDAMVRHLVTCEGLAVAAASAGPVEVTWPMFRGRALDAFVEHVLFAGPVGDPVADLGSMWAASESTGDLAALEQFGSPATCSPESGSPETVVADLAELAARAMAFSGTGRWVPRTEVRMGVVLGGSVDLRGRVDVVFGGPGTGAPVVLVEVKSGRIRDEHRAQLRHYILLAALRHGEVPIGAALWSPVSGLEPLHVPGVIHSAAERVAAAVGALAQIRSGRGPTLTPGMHCRFCPARAGCPAARRESSDGLAGGGVAGGGVPEGVGGGDDGWTDSGAWSDDPGSRGAGL